MALTTIDLHGEILAPVTNTPAQGSVTFKILHDLRDTTTNIVYSPMTFTAILDASGEFTIELPVTDNPDTTPLNWTYWVYVDTDVWNSGVFYMALPAALGPVAEFADIIPITSDDCTPDGTACAPISLAGEVAALEVEVDNIQSDLTALAITVSDISTDLDAVEAQVAVNTGDIITLTADVNGLLIDINNINAAWITSGTLDYQRLGGVVAENLTVVFGRATLVSPGTAADVWQWQYNGQRTVYVNEYACLRVRGVPDNQVPTRFMSHNTWDGTTLATFQVSQSNATTHLFQVLANGDILSPGGLSMLPTVPVVPTFTAPAASATLISDGAATGAPYGLSTTLHASMNRVFLDGAVVNGGGAPITGGTVLFAVTALHRPTAWAQFSCRTSTTLSARATIKPNGTVILDQPLAAGATCSFDGVNWRKG